MLFRSLPTNPKHEQEPVAWMYEEDDGCSCYISFTRAWLKNERPLFTAPPVRAPLTDDDVNSIWKGCFEEVLSAMRKDQPTHLVLARAIERAHGIK